jgi:hypothetical protein
LLAQADYFDTETWLPIVGFPGWEISDQGRVRDAGTREIREPDRSGRLAAVEFERPQTVRAFLDGGFVVGSASVGAAGAAS